MATPVQSASSTADSIVSVNIRKESSIPSALESITTSGTAASSTTNPLVSNRNITSSTPLPPPHSTRSSLLYSSRSSTPNTTSFSLPTAPSAGCASSMTTTSMPSHDQHLQSPEHSKRRGRSNSMPLNPVELHQMTDERTLTVWSNSTLSSASSPVVFKSFTYRQTDPKDNKYNSSAESNSSKKSVHKQEIVSLRREIVTEEGNENPNSEPYYKLVLLFEEINPHHEEIVPTLNKMIGHPSFPTREKIKALMKKGEFYANSPEYRHIGKAFETWKEVETLAPKMQKASDQVTMQFHLKTIHTSKMKLEKHKKILDKVLNHLRPLLKVTDAS